MLDAGRLGLRCGVERFAIILNGQDVLLSELFHNSLTEVNGGYLSLEKSSTAELELIDNALETERILQNRRKCQTLAQLSLAIQVDNRCF